jgi:hypothetical protein
MFLANSRIPDFRSLRCPGGEWSDLFLDPLTVLSIQNKPVSEQGKLFHDYPNA